MSDLEKRDGCAPGVCQFAVNVGSDYRCVGVCQYQLQAEEQAAHERVELAKGLCPHSGEPLTFVNDAWGRESMMCELCDCFGFDPADPRLMVDKD